MQLDPQVSLRPEPFGALAYHYGTRRLVFLKDRDVLAVANALESHPSLAATLQACGIAEFAVALVRQGICLPQRIGDRP